MRSFFLLFFSSIVTLQVFAQAPKPKVLGTYTVAEILNSTDTTWLSESLAEYTPNPSTIASLKTATSNIDEVVIYYGSWCGDSKREVPRILATLDAAHYPRTKVKFVGVDNVDSTYKHSPDGMADGKSIYRVPTVTFSRADKEVGRLIELPVTTAEADLLAIFTGKPYTPNYAVFPHVDSLLKAGIIADENLQPRSLSKLLKPVVTSPGPLANMARVLQVEGREQEALALARANAMINYDETYAWYILANQYMVQGNYDSARRMVRTAIDRSEDGEDQEELLDMLEECVRELAQEGA